MGLKHTTLLLNREFVKDGKMKVSISCVRETYTCMCPAVIQIWKVAMGINNTHSLWSIASFIIFIRLAIYFGKLDPYMIPDPLMASLPVATIATGPSHPSSTNTTVATTKGLIPDAPVVIVDTTDATSPNGYANGIIIVYDVHAINADTTHSPSTNTTAATTGDCVPDVPIINVDANNATGLNGGAIGGNTHAVDIGIISLTEYFDSTKLQEYTICQISWWDESH